MAVETAPTTPMRLFGGSLGGNLDPGDVAAVVADEAEEGEDGEYNQYVAEPAVAGLGFGGAPLSGRA
jgi:hypothetical protein